MTKIIKSFTVFTAAILLTAVVPSIVEAVGDQGPETPKEQQTEEDRRKMVKDRKASDDINKKQSSSETPAGEAEELGKIDDKVREKGNINEDQAIENRRSGPGLNSGPSSKR